MLCFGLMSLNLTSLFPYAVSLCNAERVKVMVPTVKHGGGSVMVCRL